MKLTDPDAEPAEAGPAPEQTLVAQTPPAVDEGDADATVVNWTPPAA
jgi:hypothetical protein